MRDLQNDASPMSEVNLLAAMKRLGVKEENTFVHRMSFSRMTQAPDNQNRIFLTSLKGQASLCQSKQDAGNQGVSTLDYSAKMIRDNLIGGIADPEILNDILWVLKKDETLEVTANFIDNKQQDNATRSGFGDTVASMSQTTHTNHHKHEPSKSNNQNKWSACGGLGHTDDCNTQNKM